MTELQNTDTPRPNLSTGPKTPEDERSLNAYRPGIHRSSEEQKAYDRSSQMHSSREFVFSTPEVGP